MAGTPAADTPADPGPRSPQPPPPGHPEAGRLAVMWEARAADGRGTDLLGWALAEPLPEAPVRRETFTAPGDRVLVITWWPAERSGAAPELRDPPAGLTARPVHRWSFASVHLAE